MSDIIRVSESQKVMLQKYYELLSKRYGFDCPFLPDQDDYSKLILSALVDAVAFENHILSDND